MLVLRSADSRRLWVSSALAAAIAALARSKSYREVGLAGRALLLYSASRATSLHGPVCTSVIECSAVLHIDFCHTSVSSCCALHVITHMPYCWLSCHVMQTTAIEAWPDLTYHTNYAGHTGSQYDALQVSHFQVQQMTVHQVTCGGWSLQTEETNKRCSITTTQCMYRKWHHGNPPV